MSERPAIVPPLAGCGRVSKPGLTTFVPVVMAPMNPLHWLLDTVIGMYIWIIIASVILSWLIAFNVVNARSGFVAQLREFLWRITEPALGPIRSVLPNFGGIDISPVILILLLIFAQRLLWQAFG
jgi:YggT family protein